MNINFKHIVIFCFIVSISTVSANAQKATQSIIQKLKQTDRYEGFEVPGYILRWTARIAKFGGKDNQYTKIYEIIKKVKSVTLAKTTLDQKKFNNKAIVANFARMLKESDQLEEYVAIKDKQANIVVLIQESKDIIKNLVVLNSTGRELSIIHIKSKLSINDLKNINFKDVDETFKKVKIDNNNDDN